MPHDTVELSGTVQHVFAHRFTFSADGTTHLADLTPKGLDAFPLSEGLVVSLKGERRPSEIKVTWIAAAGGAPIVIEHKKPHHAPRHSHADMPADPAIVLDAVRASGWMPAREPRRKPKHFEVLARGDGGAWTELHVDFAGTIYKQKAADLATWPVSD